MPRDTYGRKRAVAYSWPWMQKALWLPHSARPRGNCGCASSTTKTLSACARLIGPNHGQIVEIAVWMSGRFELFQRYTSG